MKIYPTLKSVPVTKANDCIITAWDKEQEDFSDRKPFRVYLPCGAEGFAIGDCDELADVIDAQCEGNWVEQLEFTSEDGVICSWDGVCLIGIYTLGVRIERVYQYIDARTTRKASKDR